MFQACNYLEMSLFVVCATLLKSVCRKAGPLELRRFWLQMCFPEGVGARECRFYRKTLHPYYCSLIARR